MLDLKINDIEMLKLLSQFQVFLIVLNGQQFVHEEKRKNSFAFFQSWHENIRQGDST